ncbi:hypothetical protein [Rhizobium sp. MHM7A]|uniref:hypothetical protein n=1 Tax=Rhizobium sp. MHM7A TaxID=2583233 RepID=UPI001105CF9F|nr:hypothetical protein [Rhizobium sp. MHM7A]TLX16568.1 hypothetical protein FFR93_04310 [Rhizobium sp. MHM7A]
MANSNQKAIETSLALGADGYRSVKPVEGILRFDHSSANSFDRDAVPALAELLKAPKQTPLLLTPDGTLWQPAELGNRIVTHLRAIAELFGISHDAPLDGIYQQIAETVDKREQPAA